ncbi:MAG: cation:proton antiporter [Gemmatimonadota bacterium]|nr:cation:proton antiporter [Gemmatimonadota bacterium]
MPAIPFLDDFVVVLAASVVVLLLSHAIRLPAVVGFLLTGLLIGPHGLHLIREEAIVEVFAEVGVVLLLFTIGLEFSLQRLRRVGRAFFVGGSLQTMLTIGVVTALVALAGRPPERALFYGFLAALSSTAIVLKLYADRRELDAPHGRLTIGILLFQDFLIVPLIVLTPVLGGAVEATAREVILRLGGGAVAAGGVFLLARTAMPRLLHAVVRTRVRELLVLGALLAGLGLALATESLGFSLALGAFLAGILIAESPYSHQIVAEMAPFRDLFTSLFFVSIGMLLDLEAAVANLGTIAVVVAVVFLLKAAIVGGLALSLGHPIRTATLAALGLAQVGEFSFVLALVGLEAGLIPPAAYQVFLAAAILTMMATPFLVRAAPGLGERVGRLPFLPSPEPPPTPSEEPVENHVVVVGYGVNGRNLGRVLDRVGIPWVALDLNGEVVRGARAEGRPVVFGDTTRRDVLEACAIEDASVAVFAIPDPDAVRRGVRLAREMNPGLHVIVRARRVTEIEELTTIGADEVVAEEFETSIEIFTRVLERYHVPTNVVEAQAKVLRGDAYRSLRGPRGAGRVSEAVLDLLAEGTTAVFYVRESSPAAGRTLSELNLRRRTGATVIAIVRADTPHPNPGSDFRVEPGDTMVLVGSHAEISRAFEDLEAG